MSYAKRQYETLMERKVRNLRVVALVSLAANLGLTIALVLVMFFA